MTQALTTAQHLLLCCKIYSALNCTRTKRAWHKLRSVPFHSNLLKQETCEPREKTEMYALVLSTTPIFCPHLHRLLNIYRRKPTLHFWYPKLSTTWGPLCMLSRVWLWLHGPCLPGSPCMGTVQAGPRRGYPFLQGPTLLPRTPDKEPSSPRAWAPAHPTPHPYLCSV